LHTQKAKIAIIGGGVAGSSIALYLGEIGLDVTLFEKGISLVNGPPICHLHAGGNLYREISNEQCVTLLKQSIDLLRFFPHAVDYRPTVIAVPLEDFGKPEDLCERLHLLQSEYKQLIDLESANKVLGEVEDYFKTFSCKQMIELKNRPTPPQPNCLDDWMIPVAKNIDFEKVKFPLVIVQEYGLNIFRIAATVSLALEKISHATALTETKVTNISKNPDEKSWLVEYTHNDKIKQQSFNFLINAAGFRSGEIDDMLGFNRDRLVEFKAAYVTKWESCDTFWPEIIFHGKRGTPHGMAQFTPYPNGYFQLHGMTNNITLFDDGLVKSSPLSAQPKLNPRYIERIDKEWNFSDVKQRTQSAINHIANFIPGFATGELSSKPLYGAQQIPGEDATLRASDISFADARYARCEIVKASSVLSMADEITKQLVKLAYVEKKFIGVRGFHHLEGISQESIDRLSLTLCLERGYPSSLADRVIQTPHS
jgi:hypothetical protein